MTRRVGTRARAVALVGCLCAPGLAAAQSTRPPTGTIAPAANRAAIRAQLDLGNQLFQSGQFADAARAYRAAFDLSNETGLLFNLGRALESAGDLRAALETFQRYLDAGSPGFDRELLRIRIDSIRSRLASQPAPATPNANAGSPTPTPMTASSGASANSATSSSGSTGAANSNAGSTGAATSSAAPTTRPADAPPMHAPPEMEYRLATPHLVMPPVLLGLGLVAGGLSGTFAALTLDPNARLARVNAGTEPWSADAQSALDGSRTLSTVAWATGIAGGALVVSSVLWFVLRGPGARVERPHDAMVLPAPGGRGAVLIFGGRM